MDKIIVDGTSLEQVKKSLMLAAASLKKANFSACGEHALPGPEEKLSWEAWQQHAQCTLLLGAAGFAPLHRRQPIVGEYVAG